MSLEQHELPSRSWLWNEWLWLSIGVGFSLVFRSFSTEPSSPYASSELILFATMAIGLLASRLSGFKAKLSLPRAMAPYLYVFLVWACGMIYELSLTVTGSGIGGMHPQTYASFILAQGDYLALAIVSLMIIRWTRASFKDVFFLAGGMSMTEGLIFTGMLTQILLSPQFWLSPAALAYYTLVYASFVALPLLVIDERLLWQSSQSMKKPSIPVYWLIGFVTAFIVRLFWGLVYGPSVEWLFDLPPNPL